MLRAGLHGLGRAAKHAAKATGGIFVAGALYVAADDDRRNAFVRAYRIARIAVPVAWDYKVVRPRAAEQHGEDSPEYDAVSSAVHRRAAERLLWLSTVNGGVFTKFAQAMSTNTHSLPPEYISVLSAAQDRASPKPWEAVKRVFEEDCGRSPDAVFASIEQTPVASASLAQVHRAVTRDGQKVAVKIQYPELRKEASSDLAAMNFFAVVLELLFPAFGYTWLLPDFEAALHNELSFLQEAHNSERVKKHFAHNPRVHIPAVLPELTSDRVLVMEWIDGVKPTDLEALRRLGVEDPRAVAGELCHFFGVQCFEQGLVHLDTHPGNLMVRRRPQPDGKGPWQLVVLDHGMVRRLSGHFRQNFAALFRALVLDDEAASLAAVKALGMKESNYEALSLILVYRPPPRHAAKRARLFGLGKGSSAPLGGRMSAEDAERLKAAAVRGQPIAC